MPTVEEIKVLTIDDVPYAVDTMSEQVQSLVAVFNEWNQKEADVGDNLKMVQCAKNELSRQIITQVRKEKDDAAGAAAAVATNKSALEVEPPVEPLEPGTVEAPPEDVQPAEGDTTNA